MAEEPRDEEGRSYEDFMGLLRDTMDRSELRNYICDAKLFMVELWKDPANIRDAVAISKDIVRADKRYDEIH